MHRVLDVLKMKEIEDSLCRYNIQEVLTSLAVNTEFMENVSEKFNLNPLNILHNHSSHYQKMLCKTQRIAL